MKGPTWTCCWEPSDVWFGKAAEGRAAGGGWRLCLQPPEWRQSERRGLGNGLGDDWLRPETDGIWEGYTRKAEPQVSEQVGMPLTKPRNSGSSRFGRKEDNLGFGLKSPILPGGGSRVVGGVGDLVPLPHRASVARKPFRHPRPASVMSELCGKDPPLSLLLFLLLMPLFQQTFHCPSPSACPDSWPLLS